MSKELSKTYDPKDIEDRLYKKWEDNGYFHLASGKFHWIIIYKCWLY